MITKQKRFKKYLAGDYDELEGLDAYMIGKMENLGWTAGGGRMKYKSKFRNLFAWHGDRD